MDSLRGPESANNSRMPGWKFLAIARLFSFSMICGRKNFCLLKSGYGVQIQASRQRHEFIV
jgi:hypothetical protein